MVTPLSQIVGTQAVINILTGKRWSVIPEEMKKYVRGHYGRAPGPMSAAVEERILEDTPRITGRPADLLTDTWEDYEKGIGDLAKSEEDVLSYALFPIETKKYLIAHAEGAEKAVFMTAAETGAVREEGYMDVSQIRELIKIVEQSDVNEVLVEEGDVKITVRKGEPLAVELGGDTKTKEKDKAASGQEEKAKAGANEETYPDHWFEVKAPMVGTFYRSPAPDAEPFVEVDFEIEQGQTLCILEAMKLMNEITAEDKGIIRHILVEDGQPVEYGQVLLVFEPTSAS